MTTVAQALVLALLFAPAAKAQLTAAFQPVQTQTQPASMPTQVQAKSPPCTPKRKIPKWFHPEKIPAIADVLSHIQNAGGGAVDTGDIVHGALAPIPCPAAPASAAKGNQTPASQPVTTQVQTNPTPFVHNLELPKPLPGSKSTIRCDIYYPEGKGLPLFFPSPDSYAVPAKPDTPEFDEWTPDSEVKTACSSVRYDPTTHKYFVQK